MEKEGLDKRASINSKVIAGLCETTRWQFFPQLNRITRFNTEHLIKENPYHFKEIPSGVREVQADFRCSPTRLFDEFHTTFSIEKTGDKFKGVLFSIPDSQPMIDELWFVSSSLEKKKQPNTAPSNKPEGSGSSFVGTYRSSQTYRDFFCISSRESVITDKSDEKRRLFPPVITTAVPQQRAKHIKEFLTKENPVGTKRVISVCKPRINSSFRHGKILVEILDNLQSRKANPRESLSEQIVINHIQSRDTSRHKIRNSLNIYNHYGCTCPVV